MPTQQYLDYIRSAEWRNKTDTLKRARGWKCYVCELDYRQKGHQLQTHHLTYARLFHEPPTDLVLLCEGHHPVGKAAMDTLRLMKLLYLLKKLVLWVVRSPFRG